MNPIANMKETPGILWRNFFQEATYTLQIRVLWERVGNYLVVIHSQYWRTGKGMTWISRYRFVYTVPEFYRQYVQPHLLILQPTLLFQILLPNEDVTETVLSSVPGPQEIFKSSGCLDYVYDCKVSSHERCGSLALFWPSNEVTDSILLG
ncbi:hypothetical protein C8R41DRAFT_872084 [Lentinula lateritia]|uniref:Uncharacterized protein n=1 Tax=Lentinula lateritia TaxID=40482 RepID=A0ABQ8V1E7_9AGAR|nr:hypothetical protein C8R41DRAFT_872084 [Lentinula lateritia]